MNSCKNYGLSAQYKTKNMCPCRWCCFSSSLKCRKLYQRGLGPPVVVVCGLYGVINWNELTQISDHLLTTTPEDSPPRIIEIILERLIHQIPARDIFNGDFVRRSPTTGLQPTLSWLGKLIYGRCGIVEVSYLIQEDASNSQWNICSHSVDLITVYYNVAARQYSILTFYNYIIYYH